MDVVNRAEFEEMLARALGRGFSSERRKLLDLLGDPPRLENVPAEYWENGGKELRKIVVPILEQIYLSQAQAFMAEVTIGVDWALVNTAAVEWAQQYSFDLITGITQTTRQGVSTAIQAFYEESLTVQQLIDKITPYYGPVRSEMIAITEVTRASARGEDGVIMEIIKRNPGMEAIDRWVTHLDDRVCVICGPMHDQETTRRNADGESVWTHPELGTDISIPAHPRCRCWKRTKFRRRND